VFGVMIESHIEAGAQKFTPGKDDVNQLAYGQSITDACLAFDDVVPVLEDLAQAVRQRRQG
jgi:3-deoxy-7-phosphoheptulonate synthase